jgi:hypothetical protein
MDVGYLKDLGRKAARIGRQADRSQLVNTFRALLVGLNQLEPQHFESSAAAEFATLRESVRLWTTPGRPFAHTDEAAQLADAVVAVLESYKGDERAPLQAPPLISIGGDVHGPVVAGDRNKIVATINVQFPDPHDVDIATTLAGIQKILKSFGASNQTKIDNAVDEAVADASIPTPDRHEIGVALDRALNYASKATSFVKVAGKLKPLVVAAAGWLGAEWHNLVQYFGNL